MARIWVHDHTVWKEEQTKIANRLGWLHTPEVMLDYLHLFEDLANAVRGDGYTSSLLLVMGGSSFAPDVFRKTSGVAHGHLDLAILDPGRRLIHLHRGTDPVERMEALTTTVRR